jgi:hypothetical protein
MATRRSHAAGIPTRTNNMKLLTLTLAAAMVMAATGCETDNTAYETVRARNLEKYKKPFKPVFQPGTDMMGIVPSTIVFQDAPAPAQQQAPQPVIVTGPGSPAVTTASQVGGTTIISTIGSRAPIAAPYYQPTYTAPYGY